MLKGSSRRLGPSTGFVRFPLRDGANFLAHIECCNASQKRCTDGNVMDAENRAEREGCDSAKLDRVTNRCLICAHLDSSLDFLSGNAIARTSFDVSAVTSVFASADLERL